MAKDLPSLPLPVIVVGAPSTGKTTLVQYFLHRKFIEQKSLFPCTNGVTYYSQTVNIGTDLYKFKIWDTSSDDKHTFLMPIYYKPAKAAIVTYSPDQGRESFTKAQQIIKQIRSEDSLKVIALVGMKGDLGSTIPNNEVNEFAKAYDLLAVQASAVQGTNIIALFEQIALACSQTSEHEAAEELKPCLFNVTGVNSLPPKQSAQPVHSIEIVNRNVIGGQEVNSVFIEHREFRPEPNSKTLNDDDDEDSDSQDNTREALKAKRPDWIKDDSVKVCYKCGSNFNVFVRKHHCRACGNIFCSDCSSHFTTIPHIAYNKPVRVCNDCHKRLMH